MSQWEPQFFRDASDRLTHDRSDVEAVDFPAICKSIVDHFGLKPMIEPVIGLGLIAWGFTEGDRTVEIAWDNWMCLTITATQPTAESLVRAIAEFLAETLPFRGSS